MRESLQNVRSLSTALGYNNGTFISYLNKYEENPDSLKDPFLRPIFDYLFMEKGLYKPSDPACRAQFLIRYIVVYCYLSKIPHGNRTTEAVEEALSIDAVDYLNIYSNELVKDIDSFVNPAFGREATWQYKEAVLNCLQSNPEIILLQYDKNNSRAKSKYIAFTTNTLRESIRLGNYPRRLWQGITDPVYFTFCFNPKDWPDPDDGDNRGIRCELWIYDNLKGLAKWRECLSQIGQGGQEEKAPKANRIRICLDLFPPYLKGLKDNLPDYFQNRIKGLENNICKAYEIYK